MGVEAHLLQKVGFDLPVEELKMPADEVFEFGYRHGRQMSFFLLDVTSYCRENLLHSLSIAFTNIVSGENEATHFHIEPDRQLTLFRGTPRTDWAKTAEQFPEPVSLRPAEDFVWQWLQTVKYRHDEHDGATKPGFRVFNERYGIVEGCWQAFVAIRPMWIYIPK